MTNSTDGYGDRSRRRGLKVHKLWLDLGGPGLDHSAAVYVVVTMTLRVPRG